MVPTTSSRPPINIAAFVNGLSEVKMNPDARKIPTNEKVTAAARPTAL